MKDVQNYEETVFTTATRTAPFKPGKPVRYRGNRQAAAERQFLAVREAINRGAAPQPKEQDNAS